MEKTILSEQCGDGVLLLTINRAKRRNALDVETYRLLGEVFREADSDESVKVIVLAGAGEHFTAGNELSDFQQLQDAESVPGIQFLRILSLVGKPVLASVEGYAIGIGTTLLLHCDLAYAGQGARFRLPFVSLGLTPEGGSTFLLPQLAGSKQAAELLMLGEIFSAETALDCGLINEVVSVGASLDRAIERARQLAGLPQQALRLTKRLLRSGGGAVVAQVMDAEEKIFLDCCNSDDAQAAFAAFLSKV